jgi:hypothetical protein
MTSDSARSPKIWEGNGITVTVFDESTINTPRTDVTDNALNWFSQHLLSVANQSRNKPGQIEGDPTNSMWLTMTSGQLDLLVNSQMTTADLQELAEVIGLP